MRDAIELEWSGIPSVALIHTALEGSARAMARLSGVPDYGFIQVDYPYTPTALWSDAEVRDLAKEVAPRILSALTASKSGVRPPAGGDR